MLEKGYRPERDSEVLVRIKAVLNDPTPGEEVKP
jgi:hypothetical protein